MSASRRAGIGTDPERASAAAADPGGKARRGWRARCRPCKLVWSRSKGRTAFWRLLGQEKRTCQALPGEIAHLEEIYRAKRLAGETSFCLWPKPVWTGRGPETGTAHLRQLHQRKPCMPTWNANCRPAGSAKRTEQWLDKLQTDNLTNPNPIPFTLRIDAGFSTGQNLTWLIEMGYIV